MPRLQSTSPDKRWSHDGAIQLLPQQFQRKGSCLVWTKRQSTPQLTAENSDPSVDRTIHRRATGYLADKLLMFLIKGQVIDWEWLIQEQSENNLGSSCYFPFKAKYFQTMVHFHQSLPSILGKSTITLSLKTQRITCLLKFTATLTDFFQVYLGTKIIKALLYVGCVNWKIKDYTLHFN